MIKPISLTFAGVATILVSISVTAVIAVAAYAEDFSRRPFHEEHSAPVEVASQDEIVRDFELRDVLVQIEVASLFPLGDPREAVIIAK